MAFLSIGTAAAKDHCAATLKGFDTQLKHTGYGRYAYQKETLSGEYQRLERFDPSLPKGERWQLVTVNGQAPGEERLGEYREQQADWQQGYRLGDVLDQSVLQNIELSEQQAGWQRYRFTPQASAGDDEAFRKIAEQLTGELVFRQSPSCRIEYRLYNEKPFKPMTGVKIKQFELSIVLEPLAAGELFYPKSVQQRIKGKAFLVKSVDETSEVRYSGHEMVLP